MKSRLFNLLKFLIGWPLSIVAIFFIGKLIAPQAGTLLEKATTLNVALLTWGVICFVLYHFIRSYIWYLLVKDHEKSISFKNACYAWASSEVKRYIPGNIWSFVGRTVLFSEMGVAKKTVAKCLLVEAGLLVVGAGIVSLLSLPFVSMYQLFYAPSLLVGSLAMLACIVGVSIVFHVVKIKKKITNWHLPQLLTLLLLSSVAFLLFGIGHYFVISSFSFLDPRIVWMITGFTVLAYLIGYLSILTPSGLGVREGILTFGLSKLIPISSAAFVSVFSRIVLILSELLFIALALLWHKSKNVFLSKAEHWVGDNKQLAVVLALILVFISYFTPITFLRYDNYYTGKFDLGNMSQTVWNTTHGNFFTMTNPNGVEPVSRLGFHADFLLVLLAPFYLIWADPRMLLFIQTVVVAFGALFVYLIAVEVLKNKTVALVFAFVYLINPSVERTNLYDFHAVTLATTFLLATWYFLIKKRFDYFLMSALFAGITKEQVWLVVGLFGIPLFWIYKKRLWGILLFVGAISFAFFLVLYAIPHALGSAHFALSYYEELGNSPTDMLKSLIFSPQETLPIIFAPDHIDYLKQLFLPLGYLSLLAPWFIIFAGPDLLINLLSNNSQMYQIYYQYTAVITPFLFLGAIYGIAFLKKFSVLRSHISILIIYLLSTSLYTAYAFGPLPGSQDANLDMVIKPLPQRAVVDTYIKTIPENVSIAASNNVASHLTHRKELYILPLGIEKADMIVFLLDDSQPPASLQLETDLLKKLKSDKTYKLLTESEGFVVFKNTAYK